MNKQLLLFLIFQETTHLLMHLLLSLLLLYIVSLPIFFCLLYLLRMKTNLINDLLPLLLLLLLFLFLTIPYAKIRFYKINIKTFDYTIFKSARDRIIVYMCVCCNKRRKRLCYSVILTF